MISVSPSSRNRRAAGSHFEWRLILLDSVACQIRQGDHNSFLRKHQNAVKGRRLFTDTLPKLVLTREEGVRLVHVLGESVFAFCLQSNKSS